MANPSRARALELRIERLLASASASEGHRVLLEAALQLTGASAAGVWGRSGARWRPLASLGETDVLPEEPRLHASLAGARAALRPGEALLAPEGQRLALVLAGLPGEVELDELEALLLVRASVLDPGALESPPLPSPRDEP